MIRKQPGNFLFRCDELELGRLLDGQVDRLNAGKNFSSHRLRRDRANVRSGSRLCENANERTMPRIVFSIAFFRQKPPVQLVATSTKSRWKFYTQVERQSFHTAWVNRVDLAMPAGCPARVIPEMPTPDINRALGESVADPYKSTTT